jgi:murein DD-endopeptidase MepM/ murein hydrolase activator NlpD
MRREAPEMLPVGMVHAGALALAQPAGRSGMIARLLQMHEDVARHAVNLEISYDLAEDIGSAPWFRGLGAMLGLSLAALALWPDLDAMHAPPAMRLDAAQRDEFRSQMILPLGLGGDSGRRMAATGAMVPIAAAPERPTIQMVATLGQGDSFMRMLARAGVGGEDAARASELVAGQVPLGSIAPGTQVDITLGARQSGGSARPLERLALRARFDLDLAISRSGGALAIQARPIAVDTTPLRIRGTVGTSVYRAARAAGAPIEAIQQYLQVLDQHLSLDTAIESGDTFDLIVSYKRSASGETRVGELLFAGLERNGKPQAQLLRWGGEGQFFEASGMGAQRTGLLMPVVGGRVTSNFGARRHPILGYTRMHGGVDFGAPHGAPIYAVGDATVSFAGWRGGAGNFVRLEHGGGFGTGYAHMSGIAVSPGMRVRAGQVIGYVGSTGLSTGPHLHYELYQNGAKVNPLSVRFTVTNQVDPKELAAYKARMAELKAVKPGAAMTSLAPRQAAVTLGPQREINRLGI